MQGTIKKLTDKNFGFITQAEGKDLFFHANALVDCQFSDLHEGDTVTYEIDYDQPKGPAAKDMRKA